MTLDQYFAAKGSRFSDADAQVLGPWLQSLGSADAEVMWEDARQEESPAHPYIEWDIQKAAKAHQVEQCRQIGRSIRVGVEGRSGEVQHIPAFVAIPVKLSADPGEERTGHLAAPTLRQYTHYEVIRKDKDKSDWVKQDALNALLGWKRRYEAYLDVYPGFSEAFQLVFDAIEEAEQRAEAA